MTFPAPVIQAIAFPKASWLRRDAHAWVESQGHSTRHPEHTEGFWRWRQATVKAELRGLVRAYNESLTQGMDPTAAQVAASVKVTPNVISALAGGMAPDETLAEFLSNTRSRPFVAALQAAGLLDRRNASQFLDASTGLLNEDGRRYIARALVGAVVPDPAVLDGLGASLRESLAGAVPAFLAAGQSGPRWDVTGAIIVAARTVAHMKGAGYDTLAAWEAQATGFGVDRAALPPLVRVMVRVLTERKGSRELPAGARRYAEIAADHPEGQASFVPPPEPAEALEAAYGLGRTANPRRKSARRSR